MNAGTSGFPAGAVGYFGTTQLGEGLSQYRGIVSRRFFDAAITQDSTLGGAAEYAKRKLLDTMRLGHPAMDSNRYWEWNLAGDPEMSLWTAQPTTMVAQYQRVIPPGPQQFSVTVTSNGQPVNQALVCVMTADASVYARGQTNSSGSCVLSIDPSNTGTMYVTVTHKNAIPVQGQTAVTTDPIVDTSGATSPAQCQHMVESFDNMHTVYLNNGKIWYRELTNGGTNALPAESLPGPNSGPPGPPAIGTDFNGCPWVAFNDNSGNVWCDIENQQGAWKRHSVYSAPGYQVGPVSIVLSDWSPTGGPYAEPDLAYCAFAQTVVGITSDIMFCAFDSFGCYSSVGVDNNPPNYPDMMASICRTPGDIIHVAWQNGYPEATTSIYSSSSDSTTPAKIRSDTQPVFLQPAAQVFSDRGNDNPVIWTWGDSVYTTCQVGDMPFPYDTAYIKLNSKYVTSKQWKGERPWSQTQDPCDYPDGSELKAVAWREAHPGADSFEIRVRFRGDTTGGLVYVHSSDTLYGINADFHPVIGEPADLVHLLWTEWVSPSTYCVRFGSYTHGGWPSLDPPGGDPVGTAFYAASFGDPVPSPYCQRRDGFVRYSSRQADYALDHLSYRLPWLDETYCYRVYATLYQESREQLSERLRIGDTTVAVVDVDSGKPVTVSFDISPRYYPGGTACLTIDRLQGERAVLSDLRVYQYDEKQANGGGAQAASISKSVRARILASAPNPSTGRSSISYEIGATGPVSLQIYDVSGRLVRSLEGRTGGAKAAGLHTATWDGRDDRGRRVPGGVYYCRLEAGTQRSTFKLVCTQ
jgi:hypothetical protein